MPLDIPREDNYDDDSLPDIPGFEVMNIIHDVNGGGADDSDFEEFTSDEEDVNAQIGQQPQPDRYANYELVNQALDEEVMNGHALGDDDESGGENAPNVQNRMYQHNFVVQWIETDEPLFDRQEFEARQASQRQAEATNEPVNQIGDQSRDTLEQPLNNSPTSSTNSQTPVNDVALDEEKIDTIKGLMSNFKLPDESFPGWAKDIPEEQWAAFVTQKFDKTS